MSSDHAPLARKRSAAEQLIRDDKFKRLATKNDRATKTELESGVGPCGPFATLFNDAPRLGADAKCTCHCFSIVFSSDLSSKHSIADRSDSYSTRGSSQEIYLAAAWIKVP